MIQARFFIGDNHIEYDFDETSQISEAINDLAMIYHEHTGALPTSIFISYDLFKVITSQTRHYGSAAFGVNQVQYWTSIGPVMVQPVLEPKERFIYAGDRKGYENALIDKKFEELVLGEEDES